MYSFIASISLLLEAFKKIVYIRSYNEFVWHAMGEEKKIVQGFGGKARRKDTTRKTKAYVGGWDQNGS
jgi:hypothetical protein